MRAFAAVSPHRVLFALALLAPVVPFIAVARSSWVESSAARRARAALQLTRARDEVAALVGLDRLVLDQLRTHPLPPAATKARSGRPPDWLSPDALPRAAQRAGGIVALFVTNPAGTLWPYTPETAPTLRDADFFRQLRHGAALTVGRACPLAPAGRPTAPDDGFVLAAPLAPPVAPPPGPGAGGAQAAGPAFRGAIGVCVTPHALLRAWRRRVHPAETIVLTDADGRRLLQLSGGPPPTSPATAGTITARVAGTPFRVAFTPAPAQGWWAWAPAPFRDTLLVLGVVLGLGLGGAARAAQHQQRRATRALTAAERFADVLRLSAERYRQLYLGAPAAMHALDPSWRIVAVTDRWLALLGYRREEVLGRRFETFLAPAARPAAERDWTRLLAGDQLPPARRRLLRQDGTTLDLTVADVAEREPDGRLRRAFSMLLAPAAPARRELARPDVLARVTGGIAHDFNNLLMVVMGSLERLTAQADRADTVRRLAGMALAAAERGAGLTARLLAAAGRQRLRPELVNANRLLREASDAIVQAAGPKVDVQFVLSPVLDPARLDPAQFRAALLALVSNAREAMPRGGRLTIETANAAGPTPQEGRIAITLSDTGAGMDAAVLARATEPFFTTRPPGKASGLGLSMAAGFARQSDGSLEIESEPGVGSTIRVLLPRSTDTAPPAETDGARGAVSDDGGDVLPPWPESAASPGPLRGAGPPQDRSGG